MPGIQVQHCYNSFISDITDTYDLHIVSIGFKIKNSRGVYVSIGARRIEKIASFTLIKAFLTWEDFLENIFIRYMCGAVTSSGYAPTLLIPPESNLSDAINTLLGRNNYLNWGIHTTQTRSVRFFDNGNPFNSVFSAFRQTIEDITIIRNAIAHRSTFARNKFRDLIRRELGYLPRGITPGRFLLKEKSGYSDNYLKYYCDQLKAASSLIVP